MYKGVIFDLDMTVVDSSVSEPYRKQRNWQKVYSLVQTFTLYEGISEVFSFIQEAGIRQCIVTTAQRRYAALVVKQFNIPHEFIIDYSSTSLIKPNPDPMLKALKSFSLDSDEIISFGDRAIDIISSRRAGIKSVGCTWGTSESRLLSSSKPDFIIHEPKQIISLLQ